MDSDRFTKQLSAAGYQYFALAPGGNEITPFAKRK